MLRAVPLRPGAAVRRRACNSGASNRPSIAMHCRACRRARTDWARSCRRRQACDRPIRCRSHCNSRCRADRIAPPARRRRSAARGIFPFRFARQTIGTARAAPPPDAPAHLGVQPGDIGLGIVPPQADRGPARRLPIIRANRPDRDRASASPYSTSCCRARLVAGRLGRRESRCW